MSLVELGQSEPADLGEFPGCRHDRAGAGGRSACQVNDRAPGDGVGSASDLTARVHRQSGFLGDFADRGLGRKLVGFDLSAGERPGWDAVTAADGEHPEWAGE